MLRFGKTLSALSYKAEHYLHLDFFKKENQRRVRLALSFLEYYPFVYNSAGETLERKELLADPGRIATINLVATKQPWK